MSDSEDEHVYANARPALTQKVRHVGGETRDAELLLERGEHEDRGEREERTVDIYVTADDLHPGSGTQQDNLHPGYGTQQDDLHPGYGTQQDDLHPGSGTQQDDLHPGSGTQQDGVPRSTAPQQQHGGGSGGSKNNRSRAAAVCLGLMCLLLSTGIIGLVVHNNNLVKHHDQLELQARQNLTGQKVTFETRLDELHTRYANATEQNAKLQTRYTNATEKNTELQTRWDELHTRYINATQDKVKLQTSYNDLRKRLCELPGWQKFGSGCYYISTEKKTWEESRQYCREYQSDLMVINSKEEQDLVKGLNQRLWLGLTDRETEDTFMWVDGTPLTTPTFWNTDEPNNDGPAPDGDEDCVEYYYVYLSIFQSKGWNDRSCTDLNQWMCEIVIN